MDAIYQLIFFFSIALLAIVVTLFVLAVSLLGRAVNISTSEQTKAEEERKKDTEGKIISMQAGLEQARAERRVDITELYNNLRDLERKDNRHKWKLRWIKMKPKFLTATWGVFLPGMVFILSAIMSALALYNQTESNTDTIFRNVAFISLFIGIVYICLILKMIEGVAVTSEETSFQREAEALKKSLREYDDEKKPLLYLSLDKETPIQVQIEEEFVISYKLNLIYGDVANNISVYFCTPPEFTLINMPPGSPPLVSEYSNYIATMIPSGNLQRGIYRNNQVSLKAPSISGKYTLVYRIFCDGFNSDYEEFEVIVQ